MCFLRVFFIFSGVILWKQGITQGSINYARLPAELGIIASPSVINESSKFGLQFKSRGDTLRFRIGAFYSFYVDPDYGLKDIEVTGVTDSMVLYRVWYDGYQSADIRIGFERRKGKSPENMVSWMGADLVAGIYFGNKTYWRQAQSIPGTTGTAGFYAAPNSNTALTGIYSPDGYRSSLYLKTGIFLFYGYSFKISKRVNMDLRSAMELYCNFKLKDRFISDPDRAISAGESFFMDYRVALLEAGINYIFR